MYVQFFLLTTSLLFAASCQSPKSFLEKHRPKAEARLKTLATIAKKVQSTPPLLSDSMEFAGLSPVVFSKDAQKGNAKIIELWDLENSGKDRTDGYQHVDASWFHDVSALITTGRFTPNKYHPEGRAFDKVTDFVEESFQSIETLQYLMVIKLLSITNPRIVGKSTFTPGHLKGEVHVYSVADGVRRGAFIFDAQTDKQVSHSGSVLSDTEAISSNLWRSARSKIREKIKQSLNADIEAVWF